MKKVLVLYYSRTGNTERMAKAIAEGAQISGDVEVELNFHIQAEELGNFEAILIGTPTYNHDMPLDFKNLLEDASTQSINLEGRVGAVFGSYGWSGEAPKLVLEIMKNKFQMQVVEPPLLANYAPDQNMLTACRDLGQRISESLMNRA